VSEQLLPLGTVNMMHADWDDHDIDELLACEVTMADHIADGSLIADARHLGLIAELEAVIAQRRG
jgi:hypothetical protein